MIEKLVLIVVCLCSAPAVAATHGEADLQAAGIIARDLASWLGELPEKPAAIGIFQVRPSAPLTSEYALLVETELLRSAKKQTSFSVSSCLECRAPQVKVDGDSLIVSKGLPDLEALKALGAKNGAQAFLVVDLFRTSYSVYAEATLYRTSTGDVMGVEQFRVPAFDLGTTSLLLMLRGGVGKVIGPKQSQDSIPFSLNVSALEELGFGKGGLTAGGIFAGPNGNLGFITPTLAFRNQFGATPVHSLAGIAAGFGYTGAKAGAALRATYDVFVGSFTSVGIDALYLAPINGLGSDSGQSLNAYVGLHLGLSLGR